MPEKIERNYRMDKNLMRYMIRCFLIIWISLNILINSSVVFGENEGNRKDGVSQAVAQPTR